MMEKKTAESTDDTTLASGRTAHAAPFYLLRDAVGLVALLLAVFVFPSFYGCVTVPQSSIALGSPEEIRNNEAVVFGRVKVTRDDKVLSWKPDPKVVSIIIYQFRPQFFLVLLRNEKTKEGFAYRLVGDGSFFWRLPPGTYSITGYYYNPGSTDVESHFTPDHTPGFVISEGDSAVYIGTLSIDLHPIGSDVIEVFDEYDPALEALKNRFPVPGAAAREGLMSFH